MICLLFSREQLTGKLLCARRRRRRWSLKNLPRFTVRENRFFFFFFLSISRVSLVSPPVVNAVPDGMGFAVGGGNGREKRNRAVVNPPFF